MSGETNWAEDTGKKRTGKSTLYNSTFVKSEIKCKSISTTLNGFWCWIKNFGSESRGSHNRSNKIRCIRRLISFWLNWIPWWTEGQAVEPKENKGTRKIKLIFNSQKAQNALRNAHRPSSEELKTNRIIWSKGNEALNSSVVVLIKFSMSLIRFYELHPKPNTFDTHFT